MKSTHDAATIAANEPVATTHDVPAVVVDDAETPGLVVFDVPIERGKQVISSVIIRKPTGASELRGLSLTPLLNLNYDEIEEALPRFTTPRLLKSDVAKLTPADLLKCSKALGEMFDSDADDDEDEDDKPAGRVTLSKPVGEEKITTFTIRTPQAGELRGLNVAQLLQLNYNAHEALLPRITTPRLSKKMVGQLPASDFLLCGGEIISFLLGKQSTGSATA